MEVMVHTELPFISETPLHKKTLSCTNSFHVGQPKSERAVTSALAEN